MFLGARRRRAVGVEGTANGSREGHPARASVGFAGRMPLQDCEDHLPAAGLDAPPREPGAFRPGIRLPEGDRGPARTVAAGRDPKPEQAARGRGYRTTVVRRAARSSTSAAAPSPLLPGALRGRCGGLAGQQRGGERGSASVRSESGEPVRPRPGKRVPDREGEAESRCGPAFCGRHHEHDDRAFGAVHAPDLGNGDFRSEYPQQFPTAFGGPRHRDRARGRRLHQGPGRRPGRGHRPSLVGWTTTPERAIAAVAATARCRSRWTGNGSS